MNTNEKKKDLVTKLIGASKSPFEESDRQTLEGMSEGKLTSLLNAYEGSSEPTETVTDAGSVNPTPTTQSTTSNSIPTSDQVVISKDELNDIKAAASAYKVQQEQHRATIIASLKSAQSAFTEDDLKRMGVDILEKLATSLNVNEPATVDYSVRGRVESRVSSGAPEMRELPNPWGISN